MDSKDLEIRIVGDDDGHVELTCPACGASFKLSAAYLNDLEAPDLWCPICGMADQLVPFLPSEIDDIAERHLHNLAADLFNDFGKDMERKFRGNKHVSFKRGRPIKKKPIPEIRQHMDYSLVEFECCGVSAKVSDDVAVSVVYCPSCGEIKS